MRSLSLRLRTAAAIAAAVTIAALTATTHANAQAKEETAPMTDHPYIGMWVTADGHVRQELLPNGRYDEARGTRKSAYQGRYEVKGAQIDYWDDTGFTADGTFVDPNTLHHGGMIFHRER
jgi:hypothetical protein